MKTLNLTYAVVFSVLVAFPALAQNASTEGGNTSLDGSMPMTKGHPSLGSDTPNCTDCAMATVATGDIGLPGSGVHTAATAASPTKTAPASAGAGSGQ